MARKWKVQVPPPWLGLKFHIVPSTISYKPHLRWTLENDQLASHKTTKATCRPDTKRVKRRRKKTVSPGPFGNSRSPGCSPELRYVARVRRSIQFYASNCCSDSRSRKWKALTPMNLIRRGLI
ncbi:unnamed protein product [Citrullus colocynthis]|uniref:Uncharacterized protein n=1 Tax=Citrullus colocynthis TaxID=252529 RepID=A0ABP0Y124_9ROSI